MTRDAVDDALLTYPLAPAPPGLYPAVMARVRRLAPPRFRLAWMDYAMSLFGAGMAGLAVVLVQAVPPHLTRLAQLHLAVYAQHFGWAPLWVALLAGPILAGAALLAAAMVFGMGRPRVEVQVL